MYCQSTAFLSAEDMEVLRERGQLAGPGFTIVLLQHVDSVESPLSPLNDNSMRRPVFVRRPVLGTSESRAQAWRRPWHCPDCRKTMVRTNRRRHLRSVHKRNDAEITQILNAETSRATLVKPNETHTVKEAAILLGISPYLVNKKIEAGEIKVTRKSPTDLRRGNTRIAASEIAAARIAPGTQTTFPFLTFTQAAKIIGHDRTAVADRAHKLGLKIKTDGRKRLLSRDDVERLRVEWPRRVA